MKRIAVPAAPGFTLLEIVVVLSLIAILMGLGAGYWSVRDREPKVKSAGRLVVQTLRLGRQLAITRGTPCLVELVSVEHAVYAERGEAPPDRLRVRAFRAGQDPVSGALVYWLEPEVLDEQALPEPVRWEALPEPGEVAESGGVARRIGFIFSPDGTCRSCADPEPGIAGRVVLVDSGSEARGEIELAAQTGHLRERYP